MREEKRPNSIVSSKDGMRSEDVMCSLLSFCMGVGIIADSSGSL